MYRINLYPEYTENRRRSKQRMLRTALMAGVIAIEGVLVVALAISGLLLGERASQLRVEVARLSTTVQGGAQPQPEVDLARELLQLRRARLDWSPKLAALGETIDPMLILTGLEGRAADKRATAQLEVTGTLRGGGSDLRAVSRFMEALRGDERIRRDLPEVQLGTMEGGADGRFTVVCQSPQKREGS